jgi:hypothetical protein
MKVTAPPLRALENRRANGHDDGEGVGIISPVVSRSILLLQRCTNAPATFIEELDKSYCRPTPSAVVLVP